MRPPSTWQQTSTSLIDGLRTELREDQARFARIYVPLMRRMLKWNRVPDYDIDDVIQTTCVRVVVNIRRYDRARPFRQWVFGILNNVWKQIRAEKLRFPGLKPPEEMDQNPARLMDDLQPLAETEARLVLVTEAAKLELHRLSPANQKAVEACLRYCGDYIRVAEEQNRSRESVRCAFNRFLRQIRELLKDEQLTEPFPG